MISHEASTGWPNQKPHVFEIHIFAATTDINHAVLLKCSKITAENNEGQFFQRLLNILRKVTGNVFAVRGNAH